MNTDARIQTVRNRLQKKFKPSYLNIVDESDAHFGHAGYQGGGRHLAVIMKSNRFKGLTKVESHRQIYQELNDLMQQEIHALRIHLI